MPARIVLSIRDRVARIAQNAQIADTEQPNGVMGIGIENFPMPMGSDSQGLLYNVGGQGEYGVIGPGEYPNMPGQAPLNVDANHIDWAAMDWGFGGIHPGVWDAAL
jgi:hypothetical protein